MAERRKTRSAMGIGISTLVTIMVVLLLSAFSVLTLVTARSDLRLSEAAAASVHDYYAADNQAVQWYAGVCDVLAQPGDGDQSPEQRLQEAGYQTSRSDADGLTVTEWFDMGVGRRLTVVVAVDEDGNPDIIQWQSGTVAG